MNHLVLKSKPELRTGPWISALPTKKEISCSDIGSLGRMIEAKASSHDPLRGAPRSLVLALILALALVSLPVMRAWADDPPPALPDVSKFRLDWPNQAPAKKSTSAENKKHKSKAARQQAKKKAEQKAEKVEDAAALNARANQELTVDQKDKALGIAVSTGTVNLTVDPVQSPLTNPVFQLGVALQAYRPVGHSQVEGFDPYDTSALGSQAMGAINFRYLPLQGYGIAGSDLGLLASVGYAQYQLNLQTPTGLAVENARLQTIITEVDLADRYHFAHSPHWSVLGGLGAGRLDSIQTATSALANGSGNLTFLGATLQAEYQLATRWSVTGGYEFRDRIASSASDLGIQNHNFMLGFLGSFR